MNTDEKIVRIKQVLPQLQTLDPDYRVFGSQRHRYLLNPVLPEADALAFEQQHGIRLPEGYRRFLTEIGDGGAGPYYGLERLQDSLFLDLDRKIEQAYGDPSKPFLLTSRWNMDYDGDDDDAQAYAAFEEEYYQPARVDGLLRICNFGCGVALNLVVNGAEYGNMWVDDRASDGGIYPDPYFEQEGRTQFLDWYLLWLARALSEVDRQPAHRRLPILLADALRQIGTIARRVFP
ncbi:SMI1/KNR4 family protein [Chloroflexia bacterium SDU3-3]|nr:SMI1/KNR4 family protein [Chloroflexia bacterium SDU3-3]